MLAIAAGVLALVTVISVMNGFQYNTIENILQIDSYHFILSNIPFNTDYQKLQHRIAAIEGVQSVIPFSEIFTLAQASNRPLISVNIRAVPVNAPKIDDGFSRQVEVVHGAFDLAAQSVVIGSGLAQRASLGLGDPLIIYSHSGAQLVYAIRGIFHTGYREFDSSLLFISLKDSEELLGNRSINMGIKLTSPNNDRRMRPLIWEALADQSTTDLELTSWRRHNRAVFAALRLEKTLLIFTLGVIFLVVGVNIYQSLKREIINRSNEIAILKAMGGYAVHVRSIFALHGLLIGIIGSTLGMAAGLFISNNINNLFALTEQSTQLTIDGINWVLQRLGAFRVSYIPSIYFFVPEIPNRVLLHECLIIFLFGVCTAVFSTILATVRLHYIHPCDILRSG